MRWWASFRCTTWALGGLGAVLLLGRVLGRMDPFREAVARMNHHLIASWLAGPAWEAPYLGLWFLALCLLAGLLLINLGLCLWRRLLPPMRNGWRLEGAVLLAVHLILLLVMIGHGASLAVGYKQEGILLFPGQARELPGGWRLNLEELTLGDDPGLLKLKGRAARRALTREAFHPAANRVRLELSGPDLAPLRGEAWMLHPLERGSLQVTLTGFVVENAPGERIGAQLAVARAPLAGFFLVCYGLMVLGMALWVVLTWRRPDPT